MLGSHVTVELGVPDQFHRPPEPSAVTWQRDHRAQEPDQKARPRPGKGITRWQGWEEQLLRCGEKVPSSCLLPRAPSYSTGQARSRHQPFAPGQREGWRARGAGRGFLVDQHSLLAPSLPWGPGDLSPRSQGPGPPLQGGVGGGGSWDWFGAGRGVSWAPRKEQSRWTPEMDQDPPGSWRPL